MTIGDRNGPNAYTFGDLSTAGRLPDGRIFAADIQAHKVRVYSPEGVYVGSAGSEGDGPGSLDAFETVSGYRADSIWVYDYRRRAVSIFGPDLVFARRFVNPLPQGNYWVWGSLSDGRFLLSTPGGVYRPETSGSVVDSSFVIVASADGLSSDTVGAFAVRTRRGNGRDGGNLASGRVMFFLVPQGIMTGRDDRVLWAEGERVEYVEGDPDGRIHRIVRRRSDRIPVTGKVIERFQKAYLTLLGANPRGGKAFYLRMLKTAVYADYLPALAYGASLKIDPLGNVWFGRFSLPGVPAHEWDVFNRKGVWLGTVATPTGLEVTEIGSDWITGIAKDAFDVQYVQVYKLDRQ